MRRAAAKVLSAVINAYPDLLSDTYRRVAGDLVARYREREESVKGDVFQAHIALLRQVTSCHAYIVSHVCIPIHIPDGAGKPSSWVAVQEQLRELRVLWFAHFIDSLDPHSASVSFSVHDTEPPGSCLSDVALQIGHVSSRYSAGDPSSPLALLHADVPAVFKAAGKQLSEKSVKTKVGVFMVLKELVAVLPESAAEHTGELVPGACIFCSATYAIAEAAVLVVVQSIGRHCHGSV